MNTQHSGPERTVISISVFLVRVPSLVLWELDIHVLHSYFDRIFFCNNNANNITARGIVRAVRTVTKRFVLAWRQMRKCIIFRPMGDERIRAGAVLCKKAEPRHAVRPMRTGHA